MSVAAMSWVWEHSKAKGSARFVLLALADHAGADGGDAYPSVRRLAKRCGLSERSVQAALTVLRELGEVEVEANAGPGGTNRYRITMTPADSAPPQILHPADSAPAPRRSRTGGVQNLRQTPADSAPEPTTNRPEPSLNRQTRTADFDAFWLAYPRKVSKGAARKVWPRAVKRAKDVDLVAAAIRYAESVQFEDPRYIKHPATWLNGDCWEDEPAPATVHNRATTQLAAWSKGAS
jgi:pyocin large subunit-like protein